jgi:SAM-dependent methyltransferase
MNELDVQAAYWDSAASTKTFRHPVPLGRLKELLPETALILDYGCGYGRAASELAVSGYPRVIGVDVSREMIARGKSLHTDLDLRHFDGGLLPFDAGSFDCCLLMAVLTGIPTDSGQRHVLQDIHRVLKQGGILIVSDFPLQQDQRNRERYREGEAEFGTYGVFRLPDGVVMRHHDMQWIHGLLSPFGIIEEKGFRVVTMNGHDAEAFQILARRAG